MFRAVGHGYEISIGRGASFRILLGHHYSKDNSLAKKPKRKVARHTRIRAALRLIWLYSEERREALKRAKGTGKGFYRCAWCGVYSKKVSVNHKVPCGSTPGSKNAGLEDTWDAFIGRMFCPARDLEVLCEPCHAAETASQRAAKGSIAKAS